MNITISNNIENTIECSNIYTGAYRIVFSKSPMDDVNENEELLYKAVWHEFESEPCTYDIRQLVVNAIKEYDSSSEVNHFELDGHVAWFDKATRVGLVNSINAQKNAGFSKTILWLGDTTIEMDCDKLLDILNKIELYSIEVFNTTQNKYKELNEIQGRQNILDFDIFSGYPKSLKFNTNDKRGTQSTSVEQPNA